MKNFIFCAYLKAEYGHYLIISPKNFKKEKHLFVLEQLVKYVQK